jgi:hypothetical protein
VTVSSTSSTDSTARDSAVTFAESVESNGLETEDGDAAALGWRGAPAETKDASNNTTAAIKSRTPITPNGKEILV